MFVVSFCVLVVLACVCQQSVAFVQRSFASSGKINFRRAAVKTQGEFNNFLDDYPVMGRNRLGDPHLDQRSRPRRNRQNPVIRDLVREHIVTPNDFMYPVFVHEGAHEEEISSMPDCHRHSIKGLVKEVKSAMSLGVRSFVLFPKIDDSLKSVYAEESYNPNGLIPRTIQAIKEAAPDAVVVTDVALDPYSSAGHDGVVKDGQILNDLTIVQLQKQAIMQARAGADIVAPSDMMDGRIGAIRDALDAEGFTNVSIMAYTAKYASAYYGPFRDALASHPGFGDKKTYQQDPGNGREAIIEAMLDENEGADILMVKPGLPYLDVIHRLRLASNLPIAAYQVSGEYAMIKAAARQGWIDEKKTVLETMTCFKRAGTDIILTYYAKQAAQWLAEHK